MAKNALSIDTDLSEGICFQMPARGTNERYQYSFAIVSNISNTTNVTSVFSFISNTIVVKGGHDEQCFL